jgi:hypothetical protein
MIKSLIAEFDFYKLRISLCSIFLLLSPSTFSMDSKFGELKEFVQMSKDTIQQLDTFLSKIKIINDEIKFTPDENEDYECLFEWLIKHLNTNKNILNLINGACKPKPSRCAQLTAWYTKIPTATLNKIQGAIMGIAGLKALTLATNALMPATICSILPTGSLAVGAISSLGLVAYGVYKYMPIPNQFWESALHKVTHVAIKAAPYLGIGLASSIKAAQQIHENKDIRDLYLELYTTLTEQQKKLLSQKHLLVIALFNPAILIDEIAFLNALTHDQITLISALFELCVPDRKNLLFDAFAKTLTNKQIELLNKPTNKILLGLFNPLFLQAAENSDFIKSLTADQQAQFLACVNKKA